MRMCRKKAVGRYKHLMRPAPFNKSTDDELDSRVWSEIQPKSDAEFMEDYGPVEEVTST